MENLVNEQYLKSIYKDKKVFVTGHTGFKGSWLITWLHMLGANVKGYALEPENENCLFNTIKPIIKFENVIADIRDKDKLKLEILNFQPDFIFHLAAQPLVRRSYEIPAETFEVNVSGTANLLEATISLEKKCSVIIVTTDKVYENREQDVLYKETDNLGGYDPYSASKACAEIVTNSYRDSFFNLTSVLTHQKVVASVRAGNVIGGGDFNKDRIIPDIIGALKSKRAIQVRNPNSIRPWQHVLEPLGGYLLLGSLIDKAPKSYSGAYNFGPIQNDHLLVRELVENAIKNWGDGIWEDTSNPNQLHEAVQLKLDITKAIEILNWKPKLDAELAIKWTIDWYKKPETESQDFTILQINEYMKL